MGRSNSIRNLTSTIRNLVTTPHYQHSDTGQSEVPKVKAGRQYCPRMSFGNKSPKLPIDYLTVAKFIRDHNPPDMAFYLDTNFITGEEKPRELWQALLEKQIVITPIVWQELQEWLDWMAPRNRWIRQCLINARISRYGNICFEPHSGWNDNQRLAHTYYTNLLAVRKWMGPVLAKELAERLNRNPTEQEVVREIQKTGADHEWRLMRKGVTDIEKPNFLADEELVTSAVVDAIVNQRETTILTTDTDVQEQFRKLMTILDHQFQGMLFAERYASDAAGFSTRPLHRSSGELRHYFAADGLLVEKPKPPGRSFVEWLLPKDHHSLPVYVLLFGGEGTNLRFSPLSYTSEPDFARLLEVKGKSGGMNTELLAGRNCHANANVIGIDDPRRWVIIAQDQLAKVDGSMSYARKDIADASFERGTSLT